MHQLDCVSDSPNPLRRVTSSRRHLIVIAVFVVVMFLIIAMIGWLTITRLPQRIAQSVTTPEEKTVTVGEIVTKVRALNRLESASMEVMHVSTTTQTFKYVPDAVSGDELTFLAVGQVIAGVDLSRMTDADVRIVGKHIYVAVPPPEILVTKIDNARSRVLRRDTGVLRRSDPQLEGRARLRAEGEVRNEALRKGILNLAQQNAAARIAELLHRAGYDDVVVTTRGAERPN